jgi:ABC-2 type transport system ATP-binding protein
LPWSFGPSTWHGWPRSGADDLPALAFMSLELRNVTKLYSGIAAVKDVSFIARAGEVTGYLGPNGSGKSTTLKMITGLIEPSAGRIFFDGEPIELNRIAHRQRLGYVPEEPHIYPHLTGFEYLEMIGQLRALPERSLAAKIDGFLQLFSLHADRYVPISSYSKGMRQKVLLVAALLHNPQIVLLDEPFSGLDVNSALILRALIGQLAARGKVVLFSSHELETVERVSSRIVILHKGQVVANDSIEKLRTLMSLPTLERIFTELAIEQDTEAISHAILQLVES